MPDEITGAEIHEVNFIGAFRFEKNNNNFTFWLGNQLLGSVKKVADESGIFSWHAYAEQHNTKPWKSAPFEKAKDAILSLQRHYQLLQVQVIQGNGQMKGGLPGLPALPGGKSHAPC
jgi:hypothetical protein